MRASAGQLQPALAAAAAKLAHARAEKQTEGEGAEEVDDDDGVVGAVCVRRVGAAWRGEQGGDGVQEDDEKADFEREPVPAVVALPAACVDQGQVCAPQQQRQQR